MPTPRTRTFAAGPALLLTAVTALVLFPSRRRRSGTGSTSHGGTRRDGVDQTRTVTPCRPRSLRQGTDPAAGR
jgi:hypothetical protein